MAESADFELSDSLANLAESAGILQNQSEFHLFMADFT